MYDFQFAYFKIVFAQKSTRRGFYATLNFQNMCTKGICGQDVNRYPRSTLEWHPDRHLIDILISTWLTLNRHLSWQSVESQLIFVDTPPTHMSWSTLSQLLTDCWSSANQVSIEMSIECRPSVNQVSIKMSIEYTSIKMLIECLSRVSIDTLPRLPQVHMIWIVNTKVATLLHLQWAICLVF